MRRVSAAVPGKMARPGIHEDEYGSEHSFVITPTRAEKVIMGLAGTSCANRTAIARIKKYEEFLITDIHCRVVGCKVTCNDFVFTGKNQEASKLITPKFETMDVGIARVLKNKVQIYSIKKVPQLTGECDTTLNYYASRIIITTHENDTVETIDYVGSAKDGYYLSEPINRYLELAKYYYSNGNIRSKGVGSWLGFAIGKAYSFNDKGIVDKVVDTEIGYKFNVDDVIKFCKKIKFHLSELKEGHTIGLRKNYIMEQQHGLSWGITKKTMTIW